MAVIISSEHVNSASLPEAGKVNIFHNSISKDFSWKDETGKIFSANRYPGTRSELTGAIMDHGSDAVKYLTIATDTTLTMSNPQLDRVVTLEVSSSTGSADLFLPTGSNDTIVLLNGSYQPSGSIKNYIYFHCVDDVKPIFLVTINQPA